MATKDVAKLRESFEKIARTATAALVVIDAKGSGLDEMTHDDLVDIEDAVKDALEIHRRIWPRF